MIKKQILLLGLILIFALSSSSVNAFSFSDTVQTSKTLFNNIKDALEYRLTFKQENKIKVLEKQAQKQLEQAQKQTGKGNTQAAETHLKNYERKKEMVTILLKETKNVDLSTIEKTTLEQQKTIENIKKELPQTIQETVTSVQKNIVTKVKNVIKTQEGEENANTFEQKAEIIWAPGTGPGEKIAPDSGDKNNIKVEGNMPGYKPGTSAGGESGVKVEGNMPGIRQGINENTINP